MRAQLTENLKSGITPSRGVAKMVRTGKLKRFILFVADNEQDRKQYVASFESRNDAVASAQKWKTQPAMRWQVIDNETSEKVAEDPGG